MSHGSSDLVADYLSKANIKLNAPVSSYLLLSRTITQPQSLHSSDPSRFPNSSHIDSQSFSGNEKATVIDSKNIPNIVDASKSLVATVRTCAHLCTTIDNESFLKLLRFQTNKSQSLVITDQKYILLVVIKNNSSSGSNRQ